MLEICKMQPQDLDAVVAIEQATFSLPWSRQGLASSLAMENTLYLSVFINHELVGYCGFLRVLDECDIMNVAVKKEFRNQKIAHAMLSCLIEEAKKRDLKRLLLEVRMSNKHAIRLYRNLGFEVVGVRRNFYEKPIEDAALMQKEL